MPCRPTRPLASRLRVVAFLLLLVASASIPATASATHSAGDYFVFAKAAGDGGTSDRKAIETDCDSSNDKQADISGSNTDFYGRVHSNADLAISGSPNVFHDTLSALDDPERTYGVNDGAAPPCQLQLDAGNTVAPGVTPATALNITGSGDPTSVQGPYQIGPKGWPGDIGNSLNADAMTFTNLTDVLPGDACDAGTTLGGSGTVTITAANEGQVICNGSGPIVISGSNLGTLANPFEITMISHGPIDISGSNHFLAPAAHGILAWTDQRFSTNATSFKLGGSNINVIARALTFTPRSGQDISGSNDATLCLQVIGQGSLKIAGSNTNFGPVAPGCAQPQVAQGRIELQKVFSGAAESVRLRIGTSANGEQTDFAVVSADGSTGENTVATGDYFVSEVLTTPANYATALACFNDANDNDVIDAGETSHAVDGATGEVDVATGDDVICRFTNTRLSTQFSDPGTPGFWKNHPAVTSGLLPVELGNYSVNTLSKVSSVFKAMNCSSTKATAVLGCLAGHLLAAELNVKNGTDTCINVTITRADNFLKGLTDAATGIAGVVYTGPTGSYSPTAAQRGLAIVIKDALDEYNNGGGC